MKTCSRCGSELQDETRFCNFCGFDNAPESATIPNTADQLHPQPDTASLDDQPVLQPDMASQTDVPLYTAVPVEEFQQKRKFRLPKGLIWKLPVGIVALLLLVGALAVLGYHTVTPAKWNLLAAETYTFVNEYNALNKTVTAYEKNVTKPLFSGSMKQTGQFGIAITEELLTSVGTPLDAAKQISELFGSATFDYASSVDYPNKKMLANINMSASGNPLLGIDINMDDSRMNLRIPELNKTWLTFDLSDMSSLSQLGSSMNNNFGDGQDGTLELPAAQAMPEFNANPWITARIANEVKIDRIAVRDMLSRYIRQMIHAIPDEQVQIDRNASVEVFDQNIKCDLVTITLDSATQKAILLGLLDEMKSDDVLYAQTIDKVHDVLDILAEDNDEMKEQFAYIKLILNKSTFKKGLTEARKQLDEQYPQMPDIKMEVYIKGLTVIRHAFATPDINGMGEGMVAFDFLKDGSKKSYGMLFTGGTDQSELVFRADKIAKKGGANDLLVSLSYLDVNNPDALRMSLDVTEEAKGGRLFDSLITMKLDVHDAMYTENQMSMTFTASGTIERDNKNRTIATRHDLTLGMTTPELPTGKFEVKAAVTSSADYNATVSLPNMDGEQKLDLANATPEEMAAYEQEVTEKLLQLQQALGGN